MDIHFNDTRPADASAATLWEVITDYASYPTFNSAIINVRVAKKDSSGAEFLADRKTKIGKTVRAYDRYHPAGSRSSGRTNLRGKFVSTLHVDHPPSRREPFHPDHRCDTAHGPHPRRIDEAGPEAPVLRHQLHTLHRRSRTARQDRRRMKHQRSKSIEANK